MPTQVGGRLLVVRPGSQRIGLDGPPEPAVVVGGLYRQYGYNHRMTALSPAARDIANAPDGNWDPMDYLQFIYNIFPSTGLVVSSQIVALTRVSSCSW
jgi:hypothetical protein